MANNVYDNIDLITIKISNEMLLFSIKSTFFLTCDVCMVPQKTANNRENTVYLEFKKIIITKNLKEIAT